MEFQFEGARRFKAKDKELSALLYSTRPMGTVDGYNSRWNIL